MNNFFPLLTDFAELRLIRLISLQLGLLLKFGLESLRIINAPLISVMFILSLSSSLCNMFFSSLEIYDSTTQVDFLYSFCMLLVMRLLYC